METTRTAERLSLVPELPSAEPAERDRLAQELAAARALFETTFAAAPIGMLVMRVGKDGTPSVTECNPAFASMLGADPEQLLGRGGLAVVHPADIETHQRLLDEALAGRPASGEIRLRHRDGRDIWALIATAMTDGALGERLVVIQAVDLSERKSLEKRLRHLADHDSLTGLLSRRRFEEELDREMSRARRHGRPGVLIVVDLDGFKDVNDHFGHAAGDRLLTRIAAGLRETLRGSDTVARIGGDEFALVMPDTDLAAGAVVAEKLSETVHAYGAIASASGELLKVTASIGLTSFDGKSELDSDKLLVEANLAMDRAKHGGPDGITVHARDGAAVGA